MTTKMHAAVKNMTGQVFNLLTVVRYIGQSPNAHALWECKCKCGEVAIKDGHYLRRTGHKTGSCGCLHQRNSVLVDDVLEEMNAHYPDHGGVKTAAHLNKVFAGRLKKEITKEMVWHKAKVLGIRVKGRKRHDFAEIKAPPKVDPWTTEEILGTEWNKLAYLMRAAPKDLVPDYLMIDGQA